RYRLCRTEVQTVFFGCVCLPLYFLLLSAWWFALPSSYLSSCDRLCRRQRRGRCCDNGEI
ncbi:uncharacterized protein METZ01_LOCUS266672, partial [marine metagenome]